MKAAGRLEYGAYRLTAAGDKLHQLLNTCGRIAELALYGDPVVATHGNVESQLGNSSLSLKACPVSIRQSCSTLDSGEQVMSTGLCTRDCTCTWKQRRRSVGQPEQGNLEAAIGNPARRQLGARRRLPSQVSDGRLQDGLAFGGLHRRLRMGEMSTR